MSKVFNTVISGGGQVAIGCSNTTMNQRTEGSEGTYDVSFRLCFTADTAAGAARQYAQVVPQSMGRELEVQLCDEQGSSEHSLLMYVHADYAPTDLVAGKVSPEKLKAQRDWLLSQYQDCGEHEQLDGLVNLLDHLLDVADGQVDCVTGQPVPSISASLK